MIKDRLVCPSIPDLGGDVQNWKVAETALNQGGVQIPQIQSSLAPRRYIDSGELINDSNIKTLTYPTTHP